MSTIKVNKIENLAGDSSLTIDGDQGNINLSNFWNNFGFRNLVINGAMQVVQEGTVTGATNDYGGPDMFRFTRTGAAVVTLSKDSDAPEGFGSSYKVDVTTADASLAAGDFAIVQHRMEGQNLQHILKGTSNAKQLTLQFWVKSPKTGTHIVELFDQDNTRYVSAAYTISTANTWEKQTVTFPADTTGALDNDANNSLDIIWWLAAGSNFGGGTLGTSWHTTDADRAAGQVNCVDSAANDFFLTGVQLEVGDTATEFEHIPPDVTLLRCQRYYCEVNGVARFTATAAGHRIETPVYWPVEMRASPTTTLSGGITLNVSGNQVPYTTRTVGRFFLESVASGDCYALNVTVAADARL